MEGSFGQAGEILHWAVETLGESEKILRGAEERLDEAESLGRLQSFDPRESSHNEVGKGQRSGHSTASIYPPTPYPSAVTQ